MRRLITIAIVVSFVAPLVAVGSKKAEYVGGTIVGLPERTEGLLDTSGAEVFRFTPEKRGFAAIEVPYASITSLEYGQKAGRRVGVAILVSPLALFSKKRKHFMTISFNDAEAKEQALVLELGKDIIRTTLTVLETRSGKDIEYQDDEARKAGRGGN
ncbi:MAG: hypothetical protein AB7P99_10505 [Vicinamibacterales bacterium]